MEKLTKIIKRGSVNKIQLDEIRIGDFVSDEFGKSGKVDNIEKIHCHKELHYYFHLISAGTILIIL